MTQDTTHTVRYEQPSPMAALPFNKAAQFAFGSVILFVAIKLWWSGWFSQAFFQSAGVQVPADSYGNPIGLIPFLIDAVCLVGIAGFALISFIRGAIGPLLGGMAEWLAEAKASASARQSAGSVASTSAVPAVERTPPKIDPKKLSAVIRDLSARVAKLEATAEPTEPEAKV